MPPQHLRSKRLFQAADHEMLGAFLKPIQSSEYSNCCREGGVLLFTNLWESLQRTHYCSNIHGLCYRSRDSTAQIRDIPWWVAARNNVGMGNIYHKINFTFVRLPISSASAFSVIKGASGNSAIKNNKKNVLMKRLLAETTVAAAVSQSRIFRGYIMLSILVLKRCLRIWSLQGN